MNYYIITQGTQSQEYSFVVKNDNILQPDNVEREFIRRIFDTTEKNGRVISSINSSTKIIKNKSDYLICVLTTNKDRVNRKIPVELLLEKYDFNNFSISDMSKIYFLLSNEDIQVDESNWKNIINQINSDLKRFNKLRGLKNVAGASLIFILIFLTLKYIIKWI